MPYHHLRFSAPSTMLAHQHQAADAAAGMPASKPAVMGPPQSVNAKQQLQLQQQQQLLPQLASIATGAAADSRQAAEPEPGPATAEHTAAESLANMAVYIKQEQQPGPLAGQQVSMPAGAPQASLTAPTALHEDIAAQHAALLQQSPAAAAPAALAAHPAQRQPTPPPAALQQGLSPHAVQYQAYQDGCSVQQQQQVEAEVPAGISTAEPMQEEGAAAAQYVRLGKNGPVITLPPGAFCPAGKEREWPACDGMYRALRMLWCCAVCMVACTPARAVLQDLRCSGH